MLQAFTLHFGSESSLQDVQKEVGDAKETLVDVVKRYTVKTYK